MECLINIGFLILGALGLVVFLVLLWFAIGMALAMRDIFFKRKRKVGKSQCPHVNFRYTDSHPSKPFTCIDCGEFISLSDVTYEEVNNN